MEGLVANLRAAGLCSERDPDDALLETIRAKDSSDFSEEFDVLLSSGFMRRGTGAYRTTCSPSSFPVERSADAPPIGSGCGRPYPPPLTRFNCKVHLKSPEFFTLDSTPIVGPDVAYCAAVGFTDGRALCAVRRRTPRTARRARTGPPARPGTPGVPAPRGPSRTAASAPDRERLRQPPGEPVPAAQLRGRHLHRVRAERRVLPGGRGAVARPGAAARRPSMITPPNRLAVTARAFAWTLSLLALSCGGGGGSPSAPPTPTVPPPQPTPTPPPGGTTCPSATAASTQPARRDPPACKAPSSPPSTRWSSNSPRSSTRPRRRRGHRQYLVLDKEHTSTASSPTWSRPASAHSETRRLQLRAHPGQEPERLLRALRHPDGHRVHPEERDLHGNLYSGVLPGRPRRPAARGQRVRRAVPAAISRMICKIHLYGADIYTLDSTGPRRARHLLLHFSRIHRPGHLPRPQGRQPERGPCEEWRVGYAKDTGRTGPTWTVNGNYCTARRAAARTTPATSTRFSSTRRAPTRCARRPAPAATSSSRSEPGPPSRRGSGVQWRP